MTISNIVLADDEALQRNTLCSIIQRYTSANIHLASNGRDTLQLIEKECPDLLITDIRMPIMDGIELIKEVSVHYPSVKIVLISAYSEFSYAKEAISCGVSEYILKPFRVEEIKKVLHKINTTISPSHIQSQWEQLQQKALTDNKLQNLTSYIYRTPSISHSDKLPEFLSNDFSILILRWKLKSMTSIQSTSTFFLTDKQQETFLLHLNQLFADSIFLPLKKGLDNSEQKLLILTKEKDSQKILKSIQKFNINLWSVIAIPFKQHKISFLQRFELAEQFLSYAFYYPQTTKFFILESEKDLPAVRPMIPLLSYQKKLKEAILIGDFSSIKDIINELHSHLCDSPRIFPKELRHRISSMTVSLIHDLNHMSSSHKYDDLLEQAYSHFSICDSFDELFYISYKLLICTSNYFTQENSYTDVTEDILSYIEKHFTEDLSLSQLAENIHFSANYLSAQIKKKTGMSYINYISLLRLEYAVQLLIETNLKVSEIAVKCGYHDSSYFNRSFCRKYGTTPEQYRKGHKKCTEN